LPDLEAQKKMDIFSAGCVIYEILTNDLPLFDLQKLKEFRTDGLKGGIVLKGAEKALI
jgi:serine/threonine protein kinase